MSFATYKVSIGGLPTAREIFLSSIGGVPPLRGGQAWEKAQEMARGIWALEWVKFCAVWRPEDGPNLPAAKAKIERDAGS